MSDSFFVTATKEMDLTTGLINARGLGDRIKRREFFDWLRKKNNWQCILFKKLIALKIICMTDELNGVIRPFSGAALTILSPLKS